MNRTPAETYAHANVRMDDFFRKKKPPMLFRPLLILLIALLAAACRAEVPQPVTMPESPQQAVSSTANDALNDAYQRKLSNVWLEGEGVVKKLLPDDNKGSRHQKFLVGISDGKTLLFAHNIDLAPRIDDLQIGDTITFRGEYVYNPKGGVMHWTHHDPRGDLQGGWIRHNGRTYE